MKRITLIGGPWNGRRIEDLGAVNIRMGIAKEWDGPHPKIGTMGGYARYEPNEERSRAFWEGNTWDGTVEAIIPA